MWVTRGHKTASRSIPYFPFSLILRQTAGLPIFCYKHLCQTCGLATFAPIKQLQLGSWPILYRSSLAASVIEALQ